MYMCVHVDGGKLALTSAYRVYAEVADVRHQLTPNTTLTLR